MQRILLVLLVGIVVFGLGCEETSIHRAETYSIDDTQLEVGEDVEILYSDSAVVRIRITAPILHNYSERTSPRQEFPNGVKVEFLNTLQGVENTLTAKTATREQEKGIVVARDSVVMITAKQEKLETEEITWDERTERIRTEKFVKITKPDEVIYGFGLEAKQDFSYWKILVPKGRIKTEKIN